MDEAGALSLSGQARSDLFIPSGERPEAVPTRRAGAVDLYDAPGTDPRRAPRYASTANGNPNRSIAFRSTARRAVIRSSPHRGQFRPRPSRQAARPYVYASPTPGVNARFCRIAGVVAPHIYPFIGILTHEFPRLAGVCRGVFSIVLVGNHIADYLASSRARFAARAWLQINLFCSPQSSMPGTEPAVHNRRF